MSCVYKVTSGSTNIYLFKQLLSKGVVSKSLVRFLVTEEPSFPNDLSHQLRHHFFP